jgi:hypothetical protein
MKKLLVLVLILGMASLANAALLLYVGGVAVGGTTITMAPMSSITLQVYSTDTANYNTYLINGADDPVAMGTLSDGANNSNAGSFANAPETYSAGGGWGDGYLFNTGSTHVPTDVVAGVQHTALFTAGVAGETIVYLYDGSDPYGELDRVTLVVPEPATIALLCLGGLLLRKKK